MTILKETFLRWAVVSLFLVFLLTSSSVWAEPHATLTSAMEAHFQTEYQRLHRTSAPRVLQAEFVRDGQEAVVEVGFEAHGKGVRLPLKFRRAPGGWEPAWAPETVYVEAMLNMARSESLPISSETTAWSEVKRLPSLPLIVTRQQVITPFGSMQLDESSELLPPEELVRHVQRWMREILREAPGPAGVDIIADARIDWHDFTRVLMAPASMGFFRVHLITRSLEGSLIGAVTANIPVFATGIPRGLHILTVGLYRAGSQWGVSVATEDGPIIDETACAAGVSFCVRDVSEIEEPFRQVLTKMEAALEDFTHLMFATGPTTDLETVMPYLEKLLSEVDFEDGKLFLGYIQK
ncbi:MAG: hypothetical protein ACNA8W_20015 [Bradymonadaceae bacterium]